jgi:hypothetical protein
MNNVTDAAHPDYFGTRALGQVLRSRADFTDRILKVCSNWRMTKVGLLSRFPAGKSKGSVLRHCKRDVNLILRRGQNDQPFARFDCG